MISGKIKVNLEEFILKVPESADFGFKTLVLSKNQWQLIDHGTLYPDVFIYDGNKHLRHFNICDSKILFTEVDTIMPNSIIKLKETGKLD